MNGHWLFLYVHYLVCIISDLSGIMKIHDKIRWMIIWAIIVNAIIEPMSFFLLSLSQIMLYSKHIQNNSQYWYTYQNPNTLSIHFHTIWFCIPILKINQQLWALSTCLTISIVYSFFSSWMFPISLFRTCSTFNTPLMLYRNFTFFFTITFSWT